MPVNDTHEDYNENISKWMLVKDCNKGEDAIKNGKKKYLPMPNSTDQSLENIERYKAYIKRASFINYVSATHDGMIGLVFRNEMTTDLGSEVEYIIYNSDGAGLTLEQSIKEIISNVMLAGRHGLLVDYPESSKGLSVKQTNELKARIVKYEAQSIINWRTSIINGERKLTHIMLKETEIELTQDGFSEVKTDIYRSLDIIDGSYNQAIYDKDGVIKSVVTPRKFDGSMWDEIPFIFVGAKNNDTIVDNALLYDIAVVNVSHYRNSADFEESSFMVGQPTPVFTGLTSDWIESVMSEGVMLGSMGSVLLPEGGDGKLLQAGENIMPERGMVMKEKQMMAIGARLIQDTIGNETAEAARIRFSGQNSRLSTVVGNVESAVNKTLFWLQEFMGGNYENKITLNREFYDKNADPQLLIAEMQAMDRGIVAMSDVRNNWRKSGLIENERTDEQIDEEATMISPV